MRAQRSKPSSNFIVFVIVAHAVLTNDFNKGNKAHILCADLN